MDMRVCALLVLLGCSRAGGPESAVVSPAPESSAVKPVTNPRTIVWFLDQPTHGGYESTCYSFEPDGSLARSAVISHETGSVAYGTAGPRCTFGDKWMPDGPLGMKITVRCSDGKARTLALDLAQPSQPKVANVDGESGWAHVDFPWRLRACDRAPNQPPHPTCCPNATE